MLIVVVLKKRGKANADDNAGSELSASAPARQSEYGPIVVAAPPSNYSGFESERKMCENCLKFFCT